MEKKITYNKNLENISREKIKANFKIELLASQRSPIAHFSFPPPSSLCYSLLYTLFSDSLISWHLAAGDEQRRSVCVSLICGECICACIIPPYTQLHIRIYSIYRTGAYSLSYVYISRVDAALIYYIDRGEKKKKKKTRAMRKGNRGEVFLRVKEACGWSQAWRKIKI